jgi:hypothetical protein
MLRFVPEEVPPSIKATVPPYPSYQRPPSSLSFSLYKTNTAQWRLGQVSSLAKESLLFQRNQRRVIDIHENVKEHHPLEQQILSSTSTLSSLPIGATFPVK